MRKIARRQMRLLIVEDDPKRESKLLSWLPDDIRPVVATSAGVAIGIIGRDAGTVYSGIVLDHDLQIRRLAETDEHLSGGDVVDAIIDHIDRDVPILVHSVNSQRSIYMSNMLSSSGFEVTRIPMNELTSESFQRWLLEVRDFFQSVYN